MRWRLSSRQSVESQSVESKTSNLDGNLKIGNRRSAIEDQQMRQRTLARVDYPGVVIKTQGRHGEVATELHTDVPGRFQQDMRLWALTKDGQRREVTVEDLWPHKNFLVLSFRASRRLTMSSR